MSAESSVVRPSETPTPAHRAFVDSHLRCVRCSKKMVIEIRSAPNGDKHEVHTCICCDPWTTLVDE